jgi:hypothetical protein
LELAPSARRTEGCDTGSSAIWPTTASRDEKGPNGQAYFDRASWPTPNAHDETGKRGKEFTKADSHYQPHDLATATEAWATPNANANSGGPCRPEGRVGHSSEVIDQLHQAVSGLPPSSCLARTEKFVVRLTTLSAWLMGYTGAYLRHWETASSRKSQRKSSGQ